MDELTLFRDFRSDTPGPSAEETAAARARLLDAMAGECPATAPLPSWRRAWLGLGRFPHVRFWAPVAAAAAVTALAIAVALLASGGSAPAPAPKPSPASSGQPGHHTTDPRHGASRLPAGAAGAKSAGTSGKRAGTSGKPAASRSPGSPGAAAPAPGPSATPAPVATTTTLAAIPAIGVAGQQQTLTATVSDSAGDYIDGGTVTFTLYPDPGAGGIGPGGALDVCYQVGVHDNVATCIFTPGSGYAGTANTVQASYSGQQPYQASESGQVPLDFPDVATSTTITASTSTASPGQTVTLTATVTDQAGDNLSGGTVTFYITTGQNNIYGPGEVPLCTDAALSYNPSAHDNIATCTYTPQGPETDLFQATYSGYQGLYQDSTSGLADLTVTS